MPQNWVDNRSFISFYCLFQIYTIFITKFIVFGLFLKSAKKNNTPPTPLERGVVAWILKLFFSTNSSFGILNTHTPNPYNSICLFFLESLHLRFQEGSRCVNFRAFYNKFLFIGIWNLKFGISIRVVLTFLALMGAASCGSGVQSYRYSGQQEIAPKKTEKGFL